MKLSDYGFQIGSEYVDKIKKIKNLCYTSYYFYDMNYYADALLKLKINDRLEYHADSVGYKLKNDIVFILFNSRASEIKKIANNIFKYKEFQ